MKGRLARGALWISASRAIVNLIGLVSTLILARLLVPADFGLVAIGTTALAIASSLTELSLGQALVHHREPTEDHFHSTFTLGILRGLLVGGILAALGVPMAAIYDDPRLNGIMIALGGTVVLNGFSNPKTVIFYRELVFWQDFLISVSQKAVGFIGAGLVAWIYQSYWALIVGSAAAQLSTVILSYILIPYRPAIRWNHVRELMSFSIWLSLGRAVNTINWRLDQIMIGYFIGKPQLGTYTFGDSLAALPTNEVTQPISKALFAGFARIAHEPDRLRNAYRLAQTTLCMIAFPVGFGFAAIAEPLILLTVGAKWLPAAIVIQIISGVIALQMFTRTLEPLAMALGQTRTLFNRDMTSLVIRVPFVIGGMISGGVVGILYGRAISNLITNAIMMQVVNRMIDYPVLRQFRDNRRTLIASAAMVAAMLLGMPHYDFGSSPIALLAQIVSILATGFSTYLLVLATLWHVEGHPEGPEAEVVKMLGRFFAGIRQTFSA